MRHWRVPAQELLDRARPAVGIGDQRCPLRGVAQQRSRAVSDQARGGVVPGDDQLEDGREHLLPGEITTANEQLQERELLKLARLSHAVTAALVARGVADVPARLAGDLVVSVFSTAFARWVAPGETRDLVELQREGLVVISDLTRVETV